MSARTDAVTIKRSGFGATFGKRAAVANAAEKTRAAITPLNLHFAGLALLALLNIYLLIHMVYLWQSARSQNADALAQERVRLKTAQIASAPLEGLDGKLTRSTEEADGFYTGRLPYAVSQVVTEVGALSKKESLKFTRGQYGYAPLYLESTDSPSLTEMRMDVSLTGDYRPLVHFINSLERDRMFFLISGVALTGQQSGSVSLRLKLTTYLRPTQGDEKAEPLPSSEEQDNASSTDTGSAEQ